jgi:putative transposase
VTPAAERKAVAHFREVFGMSERRACKAIGYSRVKIRHASIRPDDARHRESMRATAHERRRNKRRNRNSLTGSASVNQRH